MARLTGHWHVGEIGSRLDVGHVRHPECLDGCLTQSVGVLIHEGLVSLDRVAQDGMRVRADAAGKSFRREPSLEECLKQADEQVMLLREESQHDPSA